MPFLAQMPKAALENFDPLDLAPTPLGMAFGPIRSRAQKQIVRALHRVAPEMLEEIRKLPQKLGIGLTGKGETASGFFFPRSNLLEVNPAVLRGIDPGVRSIARGKSIYGDLPLTVAHESQHFLNYMRGLLKPVNDVLEVRSMQIASVAGKERREDIMHHLNRDPVKGYNEALAILRELLIEGNPQAKEFAKWLK